MSDALIAAFNTATFWHEVLDAIKGNASALLDTLHLDKLDLLPDDGDHEQAIGLGVIEIKNLFGNFKDVDDIKAVVERQIDVEHAKHEFVIAIGSANTVEDMRLSFEQAQRLYDDRERLILEWFSSNDPLIQERAAELDADPYTVILRKLVSHLSDGIYLEALGEKLLAARNENGPFNEIGSLITALGNAAGAVDSDILVASFNEAADGEAMLAAVKDNASGLLDSDHLDKLDDLPDDGLLEQAIGSSLAQIRTLFGNFTSADQIKAAVEKQIDIEHAKFEFISALDAATTAAQMTAAIKGTVELINQHRQELITFLLSDPLNHDAVHLASVVQQAPYTTVLAEIVSHLGDNAYMAELGARMLLARNALDGSQFLDDSRIIPALAEADEAIVAAVTAFNEAATSQEALAAVKDNASVLLDAGHLEKLDELPDNEVSETFIGLGILEIKTLFGNFTSLDAIIGEVRYQIEVEHTKFTALNMINAATEENMVAVLKEHIGNLNDHRQKLIQKWSASNDEDARDRAEELSEQPYTVILAEIVSHFNDTTYMAGLAEIILEADDFSSINLLVGALRAADSQLSSPVAEPAQSATTNEDTIIVQAIGATDPNGDTLLYSVKSGAGPQKGTVTFADGTFTYIPADDENGTDIFTIVISDGVHSVEQVVTVTITPVNDAPVAVTTGNSASGTEDTTIIGMLPAATDVEGDDLTYELVTRVAGLTINPDGTYSYVPAGDFNGTVTFQYRAVDKAGAKSEPQNFTLTISPVNDAPVAPTPKAVSTNEDTATTVAIDAADLDGDTLTYTVKSTAKPQKGTVTFADGKFTYTPAANVNGTDTFTIVVSDGKGGTVEQVVNVSIKAVNDTPWDIALSGGQLIENSKAGTSVGKLTGSDVDGDALTFTLLDDAGGRFIFDAATNELKVANDFALDYEQATSHTVKVQVKDAAGATYVETFSIGVTDNTSETVTGTNTSDVIVGGAGKDVFNGGLGNDVLNAGAGEDVLNGGAGNDRIIGGAGKDTLTGGSGKDVFVFANKDTGTSKGRADTITDFSGRGGDKIDLKLIDANTKKKGDQKFSFIGKNDFSKAGEVRYEKVGKDTYVYLNTDSDKSAEAVIKLKGAIDLQKGWFFL